MTTTSPIMERVLYNLHYKLCSLALQNTTVRARKAAELALLLLFLTGCTVTLLLHVSFVHRDTTTLNGRPLYSIPLTCLASIPGFSDQVDVTHISLWEKNSEQSSLAFQSEDHATTIRNATCSTTTPPPNTIYYSHARMQGYLYLSPELCTQHHVRVQYVMVSRHDTRCFGRPWLQRILVHIGPETVMINWLLGTFHAEGFLYHPRSQVLYDWSLYEPLRTTTNSKRWWWQQQLYSKIGVVLNTCFLFFIVTTLVSFILRETQERMLEFTHQLQMRVRLRRPIAYLVVTHLVENLVFVPVLVGTMFFLIEFYRGDQVAAFLILSMVWICEAFSIISLRSKEGMHFFPRMFFLEYSIVHFYMFLFPFGFSYMALASTAVCVMHSMLFFWHRYELPAVALGYVTLERPRMGAMVHSNGTEDWPPPLQQTLRHPPRLQSSNSLERMSQQGSSIFNVTGDEDDSVSSYMYLLNGEVVVHRHRSRTPTNEDNHPAASTIPASVSTAPSHNHPHTPTRPMVSHVATPRVDNRTPTDASNEEG